MRRTVGVLVMEHIAVGLVEGDKVVGPLNIFPEKSQTLDPLQSMPAESIVECVRQQVEKVASEEKIAAIGMGFPGIIRAGVVEDSPNLQQIKGFALQAALSSALGGKAAGVPVRLFNDADVMAAGIAATQGKLNQLTRVWTLGNGVGFGRYPSSEGVWEGGHSVVTLDPKENFCGCGGRGDLGGILGGRALRMRLLDLEPGEGVEKARPGGARRAEIVTAFYRALGAGTATNIHMEGPGMFFVTGPEVKFIDIGLLDRLVHEMVKMSPLQGSRFEVMPTSDEMGIIGAAVNAERAALK